MIMLEPILHTLSTRRLVLASSSPRRKEIFGAACPNLKLEIVPSTAEENLDLSLYEGRPWAYTEETAKLKAKEVFERLGENKDDQRELVVVGADTVVTCENVIRGKPTDADDAFKLLKLLNGRTHIVYSGVVILRGLGGELKEERVFHEATKVTFDNLSDEIIRAYVATGEPLDKAGAYGIQGYGGTLIKGIEGCYFNVVGFPLHHFCKKMIDIFTNKQ